MSAEIILPLAVSAIVTVVVIKATTRQQRRASLWKAEHNAKLDGLLLNIEDTIRKAAK